MALTVFDPTQTPIASIGSSNVSNILTNGGFELWTRGTSFTNPANGTSTADRWVILSDGASVATITREATTIDSGVYSLKSNITATGGWSFYRLGQNVENYQDYKGKTLTFSVRVNSNAANSLLIQDGTQAVNSSSYSIATGGWQTLSVSITVSASATFLLLQMLHPVAVQTAYFDSAMLTLGPTASTFVPSNPEIENLKNTSLSSLVETTNLLYNGGFEIHQNTNSNSQNNYVTGDYFFDGWKFQKNSNRQMNGGYETVNIYEGAGALKADSLSGNTVNDYIYQRIEDTARYRGKYITLSIAVKTNSANAVRAAIDDNIVGVFGSSYHTGGNTFEILTVTGLVSNTATDLRIGIAVSAQSTTYIDAAMAVIGSFPALPFVPSDPSIDLARCQRYYEKSYLPGVAPGTSTTTNTVANIANGGTGQSYSAVFMFKVEKRTNPTMTLYTTGGTSGSMEWAVVGAASTVRVTTAITSGGVIATHGWQARQLVNTTDNSMSGHYVADARI